jgi:outer membrane protein TolC
MVFVQLERTRALAALIAIGLLVAGCQSYEPRPLNLAEHRDAWLDRSPTSERVEVFARQLEAQSTAPTTFDPSDGISLPEAQVIALVYNADLRIARADADIVTATAEYAGLWEDPVFLLDFLRITESVANPWVITPGLTLTIPLSGRLQAEKDEANAAMHAELYRIAETEWAICTAVRIAWFEWSAAELRLQETSELTQRLQSLVDSTAYLAEAGELPRTEAMLFAIELSQRRNEIIQLRREAREHQLQILHLLGLAPSAPVDLHPSVSVEPPDVPSLDTVATDNLTLVRLRQEYDMAEHALRREILAQYPDLTIGPLYETDQGQSRIGFLGAIPLPILNANKQGIAEAKAARELARAQFETTFEQLAGELAMAAERVASLQAQRADIESVLIPLVDQQVDDARQLLHIGEGGSLIMLESLVRAQEIKMMLIDLRRDESLASTELTRLSGPDYSIAPRSDAAMAQDGGTS